MKKRMMLLLLAVMVMFLMVSCGKTAEDSTHLLTDLKTVEDESEEGQDGEDFLGDPAVGNSSEETTSQQGPSEEERQSSEGMEPAESTEEQGDAQEEFQFSDLSDRVFYFSSGAGAWFTELRIKGDGSFEGHYQDADMGDAGDDYPNGTLYYCDFYGNFDQLEKVDDLTYRMKLSCISFRQEPEQEEIIDGVRYIYSAAYGLDGEDFYLYLPDSKVADLPQSFREWVGYYNLEAVQEEKLNFYGLYNVQGEQGFSSNVYVEQSLSERIAMEISIAGEREKEVEKKQEEAVTQLEMNETAKEMYQLWDDTLNVVWKLLESDLNESDMEILRKEEKEWIASRDAEVQAAGLENEGGSLQPLLEAMKAAELTRARVYELAEYAVGR